MVLAFDFLWEARIVHNIPRHGVGLGYLVSRFFAFCVSNQKTGYINMRNTHLSFTSTIVITGMSIYLCVR
jgi:hypothetical protein